MILATAAMCLAMNIYQEARGEPIPGQYAVAMVTMNRAKHDKSKVCKVVLKPHQFSWTTGLVKNKKLAKGGLPKDEEAWSRAKTIAKVVMARGRRFDITNGATFYHALRVKPEWAKTMLATKVVGQHIFYKLS